MALTNSEKQSLTVRDALLDRKIVHGCSGKFCSACEGSFMMPPEEKQKEKHLQIDDQMSTLNLRLNTLKALADRIEGLEEPAVPDTQVKNKLTLAFILNDLPERLRTYSAFLDTLTERLEKLLF